MALFGPSGCGKSTLLNLVAGLDPDFAGEVALPEPARIGYVFQEPRLLPWLTVEDNLKLVLADEAESEAKIDSLARRDGPCRRAHGVSRPGCRSAWRAASRLRAPSSSSRRCC